jgi:hypothetical protein
MCVQTFVYIQPIYKASTIKCHMNRLTYHSVTFDSYQKIGIFTSDIITKTPICRIFNFPVTLATEYTCILQQFCDCRLRKLFLYFNNVTVLSVLHFCLVMATFMNSIHREGTSLS